MHLTPDSIRSSFRDFLREKDFPCVAAKNAAEKENIKIMIAGHLGCPGDDRQILSFLYDFIDMYRKAPAGFYSAAIIFTEPVHLSEEEFDECMWRRLKALQETDAREYRHDSRVNADPSSPDYGFSLKEEACFIIGLHAQSSRAARRFAHPVLVFNPHAQFDAMKKDQRYEKMKNIVRKRDLAFSGSVNPMLADFGEASEAYQYSGLNYLHSDKCPLILNKK